MKPPVKVQCQNDWNNELCMTFIRSFQTDKDDNHHNKSSYTAIVFESRLSEAEKRLHIVLQSALEALPHDILIQLFLSREILQSSMFQKSKMLIQNKHRIIVHPLYRSLSIFDYNALLTLPSFWQTFNDHSYTHVLLFELDSLFCPHPTSQLTDFTQYVFVGSPWSGCGETCTGGNTGFSLWNVSTMIWLTRDKIKGHMANDNAAVDLFLADQFSKYLTRDQLPMGSVAKRFSIESDYDGRYTPFGMHGGFGWTKTYRLNHGVKAVLALRKRCPAVMKQPPVKHQTIDDFNYSATSSQDLVV